jgi:thiamine-monophosphate kinase
MKDEVEQQSPVRREFDFINDLRQRTRSDTTTSATQSSLVLGIGDDAAVIRTASDKETVISTDLLVEEIDFQRTTAPPFLLGHKALAVSLSDIAAMGARPRWALLSLGVPEDVWQTDFVENLYEGLFALARRYDVRLIGGDTSRTTEKIVLDSIVMGECEKGSAVKRSGAQPGDQIFVTGSLGAAAAGLRLVWRGAQLANQNFGEHDTENLDYLLLRQLRPEPRVGWGIVLGQERLATSLIDISDGLSSDLNHLCTESAVGALIQAGQLPIDTRVAELCGRRALDPLQLALHGGEDFELLFTVRPDDVAKLPKRVDGVEATPIGEITDASSGINISEGSRIWELRPGGWEHF